MAVKLSVGLYRLFAYRIGRCLVHVIELALHFQTCCCAPYRERQNDDSICELFVFVYKRDFLVNIKELFLSESLFLPFPIAKFSPRDSQRWRSLRRAATG